MTALGFHTITRMWGIPKIMRQLKNTACREFILLWWLTHVTRKNDVEMYQKYMIFWPFCNTFASMFLE